MEILRLGRHTLKLDLICKVDFFSNCLNFDMWVESKYTANAVLSLKGYLRTTFQVCI